MSYTAPRTHASRLSFVAGACLALCGAAVQAAAPTPAELNSIVLYGSTTIAQDSTSAWGVWEQIDPPAAGPAQPGTSTPGRTELYRPLAQVNVPTVAPVVPPAVIEPTAPLLCAGGSVCGFGATLISTRTALPKTESGPTDTTNIFAYHLVATPVATEVPSLMRAAAVASTAEPTSASTTTFQFSNAVTVHSEAFGNDHAVLATDSGTLYFNGSGYSAKSAIANGSQRYDLTALGLSSTLSQYYDMATILATWYDNPVSRYISGSDMSYTQQFQYSRGVVGVTTSDGDMAALRASNATATYTGHDLYALNGASPNVKLSVNFGNGTFTGSINNGADGKVNLQTTAYGRQLAGAVGVSIDKGVITGANFVSTALSAADGKIAAGSVVQGAFFGPFAAAAGGVVNITKTANDGSYTNATFVSPFLAVKDTLIKVPKALAAPMAPIGPGVAR